MNDLTLSGAPVIKTAADASDALAKARALKIMTQADKDAAMSLVSALRAFVREHRGPLDLECEERFREHKEATAKRTAFLADPQEADRLLIEKVSAWTKAENEARAAEARRLQAIEDEKRRKEEARIEALARAQREKEEAARKAEEDARRRAAEATNEAQRAQFQAEAEKARKAAEAAAAKAAAREEQAADLPPAAMPTLPPVEKAAGEFTPVLFKARVIDANAFITAAVAAGRFEFITVNESALNDFARRTKGTVKLTGVEFYDAGKIRVRG